MPVTNPENLAYPGRNGDTEETAVTNAAASGPGFPAKTQGGDLVFIVKQRREHQLKVLVDADGNEYVDDGVLGFLVPYSSEELPEEVQGGIDAVYDADAMDAITEQSVEEATAEASGPFVITDASGVEVAAAESTGGEAIELTQPENLSESA